MRVTDEANTDLRKGAILEAAARCLARNGVAKTTIGDICSEAGMRSGHLYYYFESKDSVLQAVLLRNQEATESAIDKIFDCDDIAAELVRIHVEAEHRRREFGLTPVARIELLCYFSRNRQNEAEENDVNVNHRLIKKIGSAVERAVERGILPRDLNVVSFTQAIALIWQGLSFGRLSPQFDIDAMNKVVRELIAPWLIHPAG